ncbi:type I restriction endonuclease subunit R [Pseudomonas sp. FP1742]|uniref:type I restriction endonuclease subunit R n=1 Tax=Pseudomonas sp. FP1742 TaxID=2954079 RepID=UPI00273230EC|nr:type I restriction endonuclease subunit R [Pseudomonas sp. FP1742]WLG51107.1 type I restriction endonuclease subunit R [Pseudomonas sp. FP1742]
MVSKTNEQALEASIEKHLTGTCLEEQVMVRDGAAERPFDPNHGYWLGRAQDFNARYAVDTRWLWKFLHDSQADELERLKQRYDDWDLRILERFDRLAKKYGVLHLLKRGLAIDDVHFNLMYPAPLASSSERVKRNFAANIFSSTRQVRYSLSNTLEEIDMVLFINGLPFATLELKNPWTGQTARYHGQKQYKQDRDSSQPLLQFGRCLVHMTVDTDEVYMTTKLAGAATFFLPFNKGHNHGAGNPPNPNGHRSAYLWREIFSRESVANIIQHFVRLDGSSKTLLTKRTLFFPRYHQLDVVRQLVAHASNHGVGQRYLIQHSAGSGKSNSITWVAYQLIETYPASLEVAGARGLDVPLFDSVIVVTDRRLLDKQLRENIREFSEVKNIIAPALKSSDLKQALEQGKKIIITTIQKFPVIVDGIDDMGSKRFAVIIDEAHSSQDGSSHGTMNKVMGGDELDDAQEKVLSAIKKSKMRGNASYFAFTATPKSSTLEKFGQQQADGRFEPFHLYSMKQAIEERFILDVLANYTTYKSYYEIRKSIEDNPLFDKLKAQKKLRSYVERDQQTINAKAEIMLDHFIDQVVIPKKLKNLAKGMIITQNIEAAIRYHKAICRLLDARGNPFKALIAFSGDKMVDGIEYSEAQVNGFAEADTRDKFDTDEYRLLVVANKYLTGFDQPKLCAMYVDKKLQDVLAVQALSRLNRAAPKWGKKTEDLFVLDFFNPVEDIKTSFDPFYTATSLSGATDINVLHELKDQLDEVGVYEWPEVEAFAAQYFDNVDAEQLAVLIDIAVERFDVELELEDEEKVDFKIKAKQFVKIYGQMASIMPYEIIAWEKLFWFLKFLIPKLKVKDKHADEIDALLNSVDLSSYGLERVKLNHSIVLDDSETTLDPANPNPRGIHGVDQESDPLDQIIQSFNERWFQAWGVTNEEKRVKFLSIVKGIQEHPDFETKYQKSQDEDHRNLAFEKIFDEVMLMRRRQDLELYRLVASDPALKSTLQGNIRGLLG